MVRPRYRIILLFIVLSLKASAQTTHHHGVFWGRLILADKITDKLKWELYLQKRTQNIPGEKSIFGAPHLTGFWFWLNYPLNKNLKLYVSPIGYFDGYSFLTNPSDVDIPGARELRWTLRLEQDQKFTFLNFANRYTLEYRTRDLGNNGIYQPNWRIRYQLKLEKPVTGILPNKKPVSFFVTDEILVQFGKAVRNNASVFDQNRITAGFFLEPVKNIKTSISYLNIIQERSNGKDFDEANSLWVVVTFDNLFSQFHRHKEK